MFHSYRESISKVDHHFPFSFVHNIDWQDTVEKVYLDSDLSFGNHTFFLKSKVIKEKTKKMIPKKKALYLSPFYAVSDFEKSLV
jgi:hypothetical protein